MAIVAAEMIAKRQKGRSVDAEGIEGSLTSLCSERQSLG